MLIGACLAQAPFLHLSIMKVNNPINIQVVNLFNRVLTKNLSNGFFDNFVKEFKPPTGWFPLQDYIKEIQDISTLNEMYNYLKNYENR